MSKITLAKGLNAGLRKAMEDDPKVLVMGEDVGKLGGVFRITDGLQKDFGEDRVIDSPLAESGILGTAVGMAMRGYRPVCEIQFDGFVYPAYDQIVSQVAKIHFRSQGKVKMPIVVRIPFGGGIGAVEHHSESPEAQFAHTPGPQGGRLLQPGRRLLDDPAGHRLRRPGDLPRAQAAVPRRQAGARRVRHPRRRAAVHLPRRARGHRPHPAGLRPDGEDLHGVRRGRRQEGQSIEVIDLRTLSPLDMGPVYESVRKTGRAVVAHEAHVNLGMGSEVAARITEQCFYSLEAPVLRVGGFDTPYPPSRIEEEWLPDLDRVLDAVDRSLAY